MRVILTESVTPLAQVMIETFQKAEIPLTVLTDRPSVKQKDNSSVTYRQFDWMNQQEWQEVISQQDIVILSVPPKMFAGYLWHGSTQNLKQLLVQFLKLCQPSKVIELIEKGEAPLYQNAVCFEVPTIYLAAEQQGLENEASSIQSMSVQPTLTVQSSLEMYARYLAAISLGCITVKGWPENYHIYLKGVKRPLIAMQPEYDIGEEGVRLSLLASGLLYKTHSTRPSSFIFKINNNQLITFLYRFRPALPWRLYCLTQAIIHEWVMLGFKKWLKVHRM